MDLRFAQELGYTIKLLAEAWLDGTRSGPARRPGAAAANGHAGPGARGVQRDPGGRRRGRRNDLPGRRGRGDADGQLRRRRPDRPGRRPGAADVPGDEAVGAEREAASRCGRPTACAAGSTCGCWCRTSPACWRTWPACWPTSRSASQRDPARSAWRSTRATWCRW